MLKTSFRTENNIMVDSSHCKILRYITKNTNVGVKYTATFNRLSACARITFNIIGQQNQ